jgi:ribose transport system permease protein
MSNKQSHRFTAVFNDYGMLGVLLLLCVYFSWVTLDDQHPNGESGGSQLAETITDQFDSGTTVLIIARKTKEDTEFTKALQFGLEARGLTVVEVVQGQPRDARRALTKVAESGTSLDLIACNQATLQWSFFENIQEKFPQFQGLKLLAPKSYRWPNFMKLDNLLNIANQIVVIAVIAIGMTLVIITAGIDLSVGSLIAFSAVVSTLLIRETAGAEEAGAMGMILCCIAAILACGIIGGFSGAMITWFSIPPFIVTLGMMLVASGFAYIIADGQSIYQVPESFNRLGIGADFAGIPNAVLVMIFLYLAAHILMSRTALGRYIYAVGGNKEAARLSGIPVKAVILLVYTISGLLAGFGGIIMASQLKSGAPTYGVMYELYVIAAVVVGGTSLHGGEGRVFGTLIGAFIIAVIQNGMNLTNVESYTQKVVLGFVILGAVLLDNLKKKK